MEKVGYRSFEPVQELFTRTYGGSFEVGGERVVFTATDGEKGAER